MFSKDAASSLKLFKIFSACFFLSLLPRLAFLFLRPVEDPSWSHYWNLSSGLMNFHTLGYSGEQVTNIEPGYPFFLAAARAMTGGNVTGVFFVQVLVASLGGPLVCALAMRMGACLKAAFFAAVVFAFYPYLIGQSTVVIEVPVFTTLLMGSCVCYAWLNQKPGVLAAIACGLIMGLTILVRTMVLPAFAAGLLVLALRRQWKAALMAGFVFFVVAGPWFWRSYRIDGSIIPPRGGWNFLQSACPYSKKIIPEYNPDILDSYVSLLLQKERPDLVDAPDRPTLGKEVDDFFSAKAWEFVRSHPGEVLWMKLKNIFYLFHPRIVPFQSMDENTRIEFTGPEDFKITGIPKRPAGFELAYTLTYAPVFLLACAGIFFRWKNRRQDLFLYLIILNFTAVYSICWPATRLRVPMDFILIVFAAFAVERLLSRRPVPCPN